MCFINIFSLLLSVIQLLYAIQSEQYKKNPKFLTIYFANYISFGGWIRVGGYIGHCWRRYYLQKRKKILEPVRKKALTIQTWCLQLMQKWTQRIIKVILCCICVMAHVYLYIHHIHNNKAFKNCFSATMRGLISIIPCS